MNRRFEWRQMGTENILGRGMKTYSPLLAEAIQELILNRCLVQSHILNMLLKQGAAWYSGVRSQVKQFEVEEYFLLDFRGHIGVIISIYLVTYLEAHHLYFFYHL